MFGQKGQAGRPGGVDRASPSDACLSPRFEQRSISTNAASLPRSLSPEGGVALAVVEHTTNHTFS